MRIGWVTGSCYEWTQHWRVARGLDSFETSMQFASEDEAEPQHLKVALKTVAKKALDMALDEAGEKLGGPWGKVIGVVTPSPVGVATLKLRKPSPPSPRPVMHGPFLMKSVVSTTCAILVRLRIFCECMTAVCL